MNHKEILEKILNGTVYYSNTNKFSDFQNSNILLYGAGNLGKKFAACLQQNNVKVLGFIDRNKYGSEINGMEVYAPTDKRLSVLAKNTIVILAGLFPLIEYHKIKKQISKYHFAGIFGLHEVNFNAIDGKTFCKNIFIGEYDQKNINNDKTDIMAALELFTTDKEKDFYLRYIQAYLQNDFTIFNEPLSAEYQYLAHDINEELNFSSFIDCGAFDGDTLRNLIVHNKFLQRYIAFEPQQNLCEKIAATIRENKEKIDQAVIFPCAVGDKYEKKHFSADNNASSAGKFSKNGNTSIQCVPLDDTLFNIQPSIIKMDIEGAEFSALQGAEKTIKKYQPILAVCIYHSLNDIWRIPLLMKKYYDNYHFYIRNYQFMGLETVVYALPDKK